MEKDPKKCKPCLSPNSSTLLGVEVDSDEREEVKDNNDEDDEFAELLEAFVAEAEEAEKKQSLIKKQEGSSFSSEDTTHSDFFSLIPLDLFGHILKYLSPEDLASLSKVCKFFKKQAEEDTLWKRGYCLRWGPPKLKVRGTTWKRLYFDHDKRDMELFLQNCPEEFKQNFIQMQATKRSQAPRSDQVKDDLVVIESEIARSITFWRSSKGFSEFYSGTHVCNGQKCSFHRIDNVYLCFETGKAHVCDETCNEVILDPESQLLVCTISGRCSDRMLYPDEEEGAENVHGNGGADDAEPFFGVGRFGRMFNIGYSCDDEEELRAVQRHMGL